MPVSSALEVEAGSSAHHDHPQQQIQLAAITHVSTCEVRCVLTSVLSAHVLHSHSVNGCLTGHSSSEETEATKKKINSRGQGHSAGLV